MSVSALRTLLLMSSRPDLRDARTFASTPAHSIYETACGRILYRLIMKTILQEKETIRSITIWFTNLFLCFKL